MASPFQRAGNVPDPETTGRFASRGREIPSDEKLAAIGSKRLNPPVDPRSECRPFAAVPLEHVLEFGNKQGSASEECTACPHQRVNPIAGWRITSAATAPHV